MGKKLVHDVFMKKVVERNDDVRNGVLDIMGKYQGADIGIETRCNIHNLIFYPTPSNLYGNHGCPDCGYEKVSKKLANDRETFIKNLAIVNPNITVDGDYIGNKTKIKVHCEYFHFWEATPNSLLCGNGCPYCSHHKVWVGFNDMWTTAPEMARLLKNPEDGHRYTKTSGKKTDFTCPDCSSTINATISDVYIYGLSCCFCADGISFPNKVVRAVLKQLPITKYKSEWTSSWTQGFRYDNYFEYKNTSYFVEVDGAHHFKEIRNFNRTLAEVQEADRIKDQLAKEHDICIIRIDCSESNLKFIKDNILKSKLNEIFDLSNIDWEECGRIANKNIVKYVCDMYDHEIHNMKELIDFFGLSDSTVRVYLRRGTKLGWCKYSPDPKICCIRPVELLDNDGNSIIQFSSLHECEREIKRIYGVCIYRTSIKNSCETGKPYKGFHFRFIDSTIQN